MWAEKVQEHMPGSKKPLLVNAGEEASKILVVKLEISVFRSLTENGKEMVDISRGEVLRTRHRNELENHPCQDVQHMSERWIHEGDDWTATFIVFLPFG